MKALLISAAVLALGASAGVAAAHPDEPTDWQHEQDHQDHYAQHQDQQQLHALAHRLGLVDDPEAHAALHEQLEDSHEEFHEDHPGTRHDHHQRPSYQGYGYSYSQPGYHRSYVQPYGYTRSYAQPYGYTYSQPSYRYGYTPY